MRALCLFLLVACNSSPSSHPDAAVDAAESTIDAPFPCQTGESCDKSTQYCYVISAGLLLQPAGCTALPAACAAQPTCACIAPTTDCNGGYPSCTEHDGAVTVECALP